MAGLLAFAPWGNVSVRLLGVWLPGPQFKGTELGSDFGGVEVGWIVILAAVAAIASSGPSVGRLRVIAIALLAYVIYNAATLSSHTLSVTANGQDISNTIGVRVTIAWGSFAEIVACGILALASFMPLSEIEYAVDAAANE